jgi:hypothetical protein
MIAVLAPSRSVRGGASRVAMGSLAPHASRRRARASLQEVRHPAGSRHSRWGPLCGGVRGVDTHKGRSWGGPGVRYTSPLALAGGNIRAATPCASAQLQHPSPGRTTVASSHPA